MALSVTLVVQKQSIDPSYLLESVQMTTTTGKAGITLSFKALLIIEATLLMCI